ncbi:hypothetical protein ABZ636_11965 [Streptomyces sp. NPDC007251]|uniref:hypothetical protein n=1 Tax=unclassified Streptomyces TaxID=2593676 RepID=UPI0033F27DF3
MRRRASTATLTYEYDSAGRLPSRTDAIGQTMPMAVRLAWARRSRCLLQDGAPGDWPTRVVTT